MKRKSDGKQGDTGLPKKARMQGNADGYSSEDENNTTRPRCSEPADDEGSDNNDNDIISSPFGHGGPDVTETHTKKRKVTTSPTRIDLTVEDELSEQ